MAHLRMRTYCSPDIGNLAASPTVFKILAIIRSVSTLASDNLDILTRNGAPHLLKRVQLVVPHEAVWSADERTLGPRDIAVIDKAIELERLGAVKVLRGVVVDIEELSAC